MGVRQRIFMDQHAIIEKLRTAIGQEIGVSDWFLIDQRRINQFAECTVDDQWIHTDVEKAAKGPYGKTIAHGFLTLSLIPAMSKWSKLPFDYSAVQMKLNYGMDKVKFLKPVPVDSRVRGRMVLINVRDKASGRLLVTTRFNIEIEGDSELACVADVTGLYILRS